MDGEGLVAEIIRKLASAHMRPPGQIEKDPAAPITLTALCAQAKMNRNDLHFGFKQQFGASIHDYQTELRMRIAFKLLESTALPIGEIAERTGRSEPTNFTAAFKKHFAVLPRDVRQLKEGA